MPEKILVLELIDVLQLALQRKMPSRLLRVSSQNIVIESVSRVYFLCKLNCFRSLVPHWGEQYENRFSWITGLGYLALQNRKCFTKIQKKLAGNASRQRKEKIYPLQKEIHRSISFCLSWQCLTLLGEQTVSHCILFHCRL